MKALIVHNYHRSGSASGDDQVFDNESILLESSGVEVIRYSISNDAFDSAGLLGKLSDAFGMMWSSKHYRAIRRIIEEEQPDIMHVHTFFPLLSPSVLYAAKRAGVSVVATLHDTRFICPVATSLRNGELCNECADGRYFRMVCHKCFKGSGLRSLLVAAIFKYHRWRKSFYNQIDRYICLNDSQISLLKEVGFDQNKMVKKYNFVNEPTFDEASLADYDLPGRYVTYYGRLGEEKGIRILMAAWDDLGDIPLVVMGGGPLREEFQAWAQGRKNVHYLGYVPHDKCLGIVRNSEFVVFPSIWYEGCSMVEIESESLGKPIVATDLGFSAEAIEDGKNGVKFSLGDTGGFVRAVRGLWSNQKLIRQMGVAAAEDYKSKYRAVDNIEQLIEVYEGLLG